MRWTTIKAWVGRLVRWSLTAGVLMLIAGMIGGWWWLEQLRDDLPESTQLSELQPDYGTRVQARDGRWLGGQRVVEPVDYEELPPELIAAFVAAEDEDFFSHDGYNVRSILRALHANFRAGDTIQGASTITQQVAQQFLEPERSWRRKVRELLLAQRIEDEYTKPEILEAYLGSVYFGQRARGITQASHTYFARCPTELTVDQMATLAGVLPAPSLYNPVDNPRIATRQRNRVLHRMHQLGMLTEQRYDQLTDRPVEGPETTSPPISAAPEATNTVRRQFDELLEETVGEQQDWSDSHLEVVTTHHRGYQALLRDAIQTGVERHDRRRGWRGPAGHAPDPDAFDEALDETGPPEEFTLGRIDAIDDDGLAVRIPTATTRIGADTLGWVHGLDPDTGDSRAPGANWSQPFSQNQVVILRRDQDHWQLWQWPDHQGAGMAVDHHSGEVLASVGAYEVELTEFHRAEQACRQPGSLFKTVVYTEAFDRDLTPAALVSDVPGGVETREGVWQPRNADHDFSGYLTALDAFVFSRNIPAVNLFDHLGADSVINRAERMGIDSQLAATPALALGASCTSVAEMVDAHATIARGGVRRGHDAVALVRDASTGRVYDRGDVLQRAPDAAARLVRAAAEPQRRHRAISPEGVALMTHALHEVTTRGTAAELPDDWPVGAKTGTSDDYDTWLAAFDPSLTATVWIGSDHYDTPFESGEHAGTVAVPTFARFYEGLAPEVDDWPPAGDDTIEKVRIDSSTGLRARDGQPGRLYPFRPGTAPNEYAPTRGTRQLQQFDAAMY